MCSLEIKLYTFIRQYIFDQSAIMIINHVCIYINLIPFNFHSWGKAISVPYCPDSEVAWTATHTHTHTHTCARTHITHDVTQFSPELIHFDNSPYISSISQSVEAHAH